MKYMIIQMILSNAFRLPQFLHNALYRITGMVIVKYITNPGGSLLYFSFQKWNNVLKDIPLD